MFSWHLLRGGGFKPYCLRLSLRQSAIGTYCVGLDILWWRFSMHIKFLIFTWQPKGGGLNPPPPRRSATGEVTKTYTSHTVACTYRVCIMTICMYLPQAWNSIQNFNQVQNVIKINIPERSAECRTAMWKRTFSWIIWRKKSFKTIGSTLLKLL